MKSYADYPQTAAEAHVMGSTPGPRAAGDPAGSPQPLACNLSVMSDAQRRRHEQVIHEFFTQRVQEMQDLPDGLAFRSDGSNLLLAAEFISLEHLCCSFFNFSLTIDAASPSFWLHIRGPEGVKAFLQGGFGSITTPLA